MTTELPPTLCAGYRPGLVGRIVEMHATHYAANWGFGRAFEAVVARGLADFMDRLDNKPNRIWALMDGGRIVGSIAIDGEDMGAGTAHLRWFIIENGLRGGGHGKALLDAALGFVDSGRFTETRLWTFAGLDAARRLYETRGFVLAQEHRGDQWGTEVLEQMFVRPRPAPGLRRAAGPDLV